MRFKFNELYLHCISTHAPDTMLLSITFLVRQFLITKFIEANYGFADKDVNVCCACFALLCKMKVIQENNAASSVNP